MKKIIAVYEIRSNITNKIYIGSTSNYKNRISNHIRLLKKNKHPNLKLQNHANKYGITDLCFSILIILDDVDLLIKYEQYYIDILLPFFNIRMIADRNFGIHHKWTEKRRINYRYNKYNKQKVFKLIDSILKN